MHDWHGCPRHGYYVGDGGCHWCKQDERQISCDGLFLIFDTSKHNGWPVDVDALFGHIGECADCYKAVTLARAMNRPKTDRQE